MSKIKRRELLLWDIIACIGTRKLLAKLLFIKLHTINGWLYSNSEIDLDHAMAMQKFYVLNGYVLTVLYNKVITEKEVCANKLYLYTVEGSVEYLVKDIFGKVRKIKINPPKNDNYFLEVKTILENGCEKKQLSDIHISWLYKLLSKNGHNLKKGYKFTPLDLSTHVKCVPVEDVEFRLEGDKPQLSISSRVGGLQKEMADLGRRRGRKRKNALPNDLLTGKTIQLFYKKWGFKSEDEYFRAARVVAYGDPKLIHAMDRGEISTSKAAKEVTYLKKQKLTLGKEIYKG